jgi:hypothetical protein
MEYTAYQMTLAHGIISFGAKRHAGQDYQHDSPAPTLVSCIRSASNNARGEDPRTSVSARTVSVVKIRTRQSQSVC